ncbi:MAG: DUF4838 domain-containing protein [Christensenellales bacterium]|jgi:hypothetical protein
MKEYILAEHGLSTWHIIMPHPAHETIKLAAHELHHYIMRMSGASLPTQTEMQPAVGPEILVGISDRLAHYNIDVDWSSLGEEGFVHKSGAEWLLLAGATPRATLYAVYAFLEEHLGCRWFASDCEVIPRTDRLTCGHLDCVEKPAFESREAYWTDAFNGEYAVRNRMNSNKADISIRQGGRMKFYNFHHSFSDLVSPKEYFDSHPEYFSQVNGVRLRDHSQLCLTNPDVLELSIAKVRQWIKENPDCRVFSVAQNDWHNYCTCPDCAAIDEKEGSPAGTMLHFVNAIAEALHPEYPHILLHTFAYQYTRKPPLYIKPHPNVIVRLCSIECCFSHPLEGNILAPLHPDAKQAWKHAGDGQCAAEGEEGFLNDLHNWSKICKRLYVWDYVTAFQHYLLPFPNFDVLQNNMQFFHKIGVAGILEQGNFSQGGGGHLAELQAYLQAKLMWNPYCDLEMQINDFLCGYYGEQAAPFIRSYIQLWQEAARPWHVSIGANPQSPFITDDVILQATKLLSEAKWRSHNTQHRNRIHKLILSMNYIILSRMPVDTIGRESFLERFGWELREAGITEIHERWTLHEALENMKLEHHNKRRKVVNDYKM